MKAKGIIAIVLSVAAAGGGIYGAYTYAANHTSPVKVVSVSMVNYGGWDDDEQTMYGEIISRDSQSVEKDNDHNVSEVYVKTGDTVKKGDKLLSYDMELTEIQAEAENITYQELEYSLEKQQATLKKLKAGDTSSLYSGSSVADADDSDDGDDSADLSYSNEDDNTGSSDEETIVEEDTPVISDGEVIIDDPSDEENIISDPGDVIDEGGSDLSEGDDTGSDIISDEEDGEAEDLSSLTTDATSFIQRVVLIQKQNQDALNINDINTALGLWERIAEHSEETDTVVDYSSDPLGESRTIANYTLKGELTSQPTITSDVSQSLYNAYRILARANLLYWYQQLNVQGDPQNLDDATIAAASSTVNELLDAWYRYNTIKTTDEGGLSEKQYGGIEDSAMANIKSVIDAWAARINLGSTVQETETNAPVETEPVEPDGFDDGGDDWGGDDGGDGGSDYTAEEIKTMIQDQEAEIEETQLEIRESEIKLGQYQRELDRKTVYATMDGVVKYAGTVDGGSSEDSFIMITGQAGMYLKGTVNELALDTVKIGDRLTGMSYENGATFEAEVVEISTYPVDNNDEFMGYSMENGNASYYPFYAYIADADDILEGQCEMAFSGSGSSGGLYLENYLIRKEKNGKAYVYVRGKDDLLEKRYIRTGASMGGFATQVKSGLTLDDYIAFPYGKGVTDGAKTVLSDTLEDEY